MEHFHFYKISISITLISSTIFKVSFPPSEPPSPHFAQAGKQIGQLTHDQVWVPRGSLHLAKTSRLLKSGNWPQSWSILSWEVYWSHFWPLTGANLHQNGTYSLELEMSSTLGKLDKGASESQFHPAVVSIKSLVEEKCEQSCSKKGLCICCQATCFKSQLSYYLNFFESQLPL